MLKGLFSSTIRADVLSLLFGSPGEKFYVREMASLLQKNPSGIKRELDRLERIGVLESERVSNHKYFKAKTRSPIYRDLKGLVFKSMGLTQSIRAAVMAAGANKAFIYGPFASGRASSTVDLVVVGARTSLLRKFREIEKLFGCTIKWIEVGAEEFSMMKKANQGPESKIMSSKRITLLGRI